MTNRDRPATTLTKREHAALAIYLADPDLDAEGAVHLADELFDVLDTPAELRDQDISAMREAHGLFAELAEVLGPDHDRP